VGLVAMKPYHGGTLLSLGDKPSGITPAQCLSYVFSQPVSTAVPGPRTVQEWQAALRYPEATDEERDYRPVVENLHDHLEGQCTYCDHCLPCPEGIRIGALIWLADYARHGINDDLRGWYAAHPIKASACGACGACLARCPFDVDIIAKMQEAVVLFESVGGGCVVEQRSPEAVARVAESYTGQFLQRVLAAVVAIDPRLR